MTSTSAAITELKLEIIHLTSSCLLREPKLQFVSEQDECAGDANAALLERIRFLVYRISREDGEYVPKLALYLRHELNLRTMPNFLMALCAREPPCLATYQCYLEKVLVLPSDWLDVANFSYFCDNDWLHEKLHTDANPALKAQKSTQRLTSALRQALNHSFPMFDDFALAKYNNEKSEKRHRSKLQGKRKEKFTLKEVIRLAHISSPAYTICCILGKRYPSTKGEFIRMGLDDAVGGRRHYFDPLLAGTRMSLAEPVTWERALSARGNTAEVWEDLFRLNAVPFMATLRNLRNIILRCCNDETHQRIVSRLRNEEQVAQSRQFPYRFYSAREAVLEVDAIVAAEAKRSVEKPSVIKRKPKLKMKGEKRAKSRTVVPCSISAEMKQRQGELLAALDDAVQISTKLNIPPMRGTSVIIFSLFPRLLKPMGAGKAGRGKPVSKRSQLDAIALLVSMMYRACEKCVLILHCLHAYRLYSPPDDKLSILERTERLVEECTQMIEQMCECEPEWAADTQTSRCTKGRFPFAELDQFVTERQTIESVVVLDEGHHTYACMNTDAPSFGDLPVYLSRLRRGGSPNLVFVGINVGGSSLAKKRTKSSETYLASRYSQRNDFLVSGFSDAIVKLIAERTGGGPQEIIERADVTYEVVKTSSRLTNEALEKKRRVLSLIQRLEPAMGKQENEKEMPSPLLVANHSIDADFHGVKEGSLLAGAASAASTSTAKQFSNPLSYTGTTSVKEMYALHSSDQYSTFSELPTLPVLQGVTDYSSFFNYYSVKNASEESGSPPNAAREELSSAGAVVKGPSSDALLNGAEGQRPVEVFAAPSRRRLLSTYRVWRFFISSTFLDMNNERNALTLDVFPRLRRWIADAGIKVNLMEVDLRWGITEDSTARNMSTSVCLNEVVRCSPFFIGILGSRYGYIPDPLKVVADDDVSSRDFDWLQDAALYEKCSVTELEMKQGIFSSRRRLDEKESACSTLFFARDSEYLSQSLKTNAERTAYTAESPSAAERLRRLEAYVQSQGLDVIRYKCAPKRAGSDGETSGSDASRVSQLFTDPFCAGLPSLNQEAEVLSTAVDSKRALLNMRDFSRKAFRSLQKLIAKTFNIPLGDAEGRVATVGKQEDAELLSFSESYRDPALLPVGVPTTREESGNEPGGAAEEEGHSTSRASSARQLSSDYYASLYVDNRTFMESLCKIYVPPHGFIPQLVAFSCKLSSVASGPPRAAEELRNAQSSQDTHQGSCAEDSTDVLLVTSQDGNGKSSALAALTQYLIELKTAKTHAIYYSFQGAGVSAVRAMLFFVATTLVIRADLHSAIFIDEGADTERLLALFPRIGNELRSRQLSCVIIIDAVDYCDDAADCCRCVQYLFSCFAGTESRFVLSSTPHAPVAQELQKSLVQCGEVSVPALSEEERANVVRRHLASYGKRLQETYDMNELRGLLSKQESGKASYLTMALMHLRLFSSFDSLRSDIKRLPGTTLTLFPLFFRELERRFDRDTCFAVFASLYLRHSAGGMMEYNLYRLMSNVAAATRLIALLSGTCVVSRGGCVSIRTSVFYNAIGEAYFGSASSAVRISEQILAAELLGEPIDTGRDSMRTLNIIRSLVRSIERAVREEDAPPSAFQPHRYSPQELLGILQTCVQAQQQELTVTLISFLPVLESLLLEAPIFQRFMSFLGQLRASGSSVTCKVVGPIHAFLQQHYHILTERPDLLRQCVRNMPLSFTAIKEPMSTSRQHKRTPQLPAYRLEDNAVGGSVTSPGTARRLPSTSPPLSTFWLASEAAGETGSGVHTSACEGEGMKSPALETSEFERRGLNRKDDETWVRWSNYEQHGGEARQSVFTPSNRPVRLMTLSSSGLCIAFSCEELVVRVSNVSDFHKPAVGSLNHPLEVTALSFCSNSESLLLCGTIDGRVWLWGVQSGVVMRVGVYHTRAVSSICVHPVDSLTCSASLDTYCIIWDTSVQNGGKSKLRQNLEEILETKPASLRATAFRVKNHKKGNAAPLIPLLCLRDHSFPVAAACFHRGGAVLATGAWNGAVVMYDFSRLRDDSEDVASLSDCFTRYTVQVGSSVRVLCFTPSIVPTCAAGRIDGKISILDFSSLSESACISGLHHTPVSALSFSCDGKLMASADTDGVVYLSYTGVMGTILAAFNGHRDHVTAALFLEDGKQQRLLTSSLDRTIQVWRVDTEAKAALPTAHSGPVTALACTLDGKTFVTGGEDGMAFVFTLEEDVSSFYSRCRAYRRPQQRGQTLRLYGAQMMDYRKPSFALSHEGKRVSIIRFGLADTRLLTGVVTGTVYVWSSEPGLDRRSGRLLFRVHAPSLGCYPIISLECVDERTNGTQGFCTYAEREGDGEAVESQRVAKDATAARVVAICANGETLSFDLYSDAVSLALLQQSKEEVASNGMDSPGQLSSSSFTSSGDDESTSPQSNNNSLNSRSAGNSTQMTESLSESLHLEKVYRACRERMQWRRPETDGGTAGEHRTDASHFHKNVERREEDKDSRGQGDSSSDGLPEEAWPGEAEEKEYGSAQSMAYTYGEEIIGAIPIHFRSKTSRLRCRNLSAAADVRTGNSALALPQPATAHNIRPGGDAAHMTKRDVEQYYALLVGRTKVFLSNFVERWIMPLPLQLDDSAAGSALDKCREEVFTYVSRSDRIYHSDGSFLLCFAVCTSLSSVLLCKVHLRDDLPNCGSPFVANGLPRLPDAVVLTRLCSGGKSPDANGTPLTSSKLFACFERVETVDLRLIDPQTHSHAEDREEGGKQTETAPSATLLLQLGCFDGSTHLCTASIDDWTTKLSAPLSVKELGAFYASSTVTHCLLLPLFGKGTPESRNQVASKKILHRMGLLTGEETALCRSPLLHWVAGDYLGNIYQLRRVTEGGIDKKCTDDNQYLPQRHGALLGASDTPLQSAFQHISFMPAGHQNSVLPESGAGLLQDLMAMLPPLEERVVPQLPTAAVQTDSFGLVSVVNAQMKAQMPALPANSLPPHARFEIGVPKAKQKDTAAKGRTSEQSKPSECSGQDMRSRKEKESYFSVLKNPLKDRLEGAEAFEYYKQRSEVLKEALRVQHYNTEARDALMTFGRRAGAAMIAQLDG